MAADRHAVGRCVGRNPLRAHWRCEGSFPTTARARASDFSERLERASEYRCSQARWLHRYPRDLGSRKLARRAGAGPLRHHSRAHRPAGAGADKYMRVGTHRHLVIETGQRHFDQVGIGVNKEMLAVAQLPSALCQPWLSPSHTRKWQVGRAAPSRARSAQSSGKGYCTGSRGRRMCETNQRANI